MNLKRILFVATALLFSLVGQASHQRGGSIRYTNVTNANTPSGFNDYYIEIELLRDPSGITMPAILSVTFTRRPIGNYSATNYNFPQIGSYTTLSQACGATGTVESYIYGDTVSLVEYGAYDIRYANCCRNANINNIANASSQGNVVLATLVSGKPARNYNNSPTFSSSVKSFPVGQATFDICGPDPDGDSLYIELITPHNNTTNSANIYPVTYATGYSLSEPFGDSASFFIDTLNRTITVQSSIQQICVIAFKVSEYVKDTAGVWRYYGSIERDEQYYITAPISGTAGDTLEIVNAGTPTGNPSDSVLVDLNFNAYPVMFDVDSLQMVLSHASKSAYVQSVEITTSNDQLLLRTDVPLAPGNWTLHIGESADSLFLYSQCGNTLDDSLTFYVDIPIDTNYIVGPDSAYTGVSEFYHLYDISYVDSVNYSVTNGFWWNPTSAPNDTVEITWTVPPAKLEASVFIGDTIIVLTKEINVNGIGLGENDLSEITLAPQPSNSHVVLLGLVEPMEYKLLNTLGEVVAMGKVGPNEQISLEHLSSGSYYLELFDAERRRNWVLLKQ